MSSAFTLTGSIHHFGGSPLTSGTVTATPSISPVRDLSTMTFRWGDAEADLDAEGRFSLALLTAEGLHPEDASFVYTITATGNAVGPFTLTPAAPGAVVDLIDLTDRA